MLFLLRRELAGAFRTLPAQHVVPALPKRELASYLESDQCVFRRVVNAVDYVVFVHREDKFEVFNLTQS